MFPIPLSLLLVSLAELSASSPVQDETQTEITVLTKLEALSSRMSITEKETKDLRAENVQLKAKLGEVLKIVSDQQVKLQQFQRALDVTTQSDAETRSEGHVFNSRPKQKQRNKKEEHKGRHFEKIPVVNYPITNSSSVHALRKNETSLGCRDRYRSKERIVQRPRAQRLLLPATTKAPLSVTISPRVAFSVHLRSNLGHLGPHHPIVFDVVDVNVGGSYHEPIGVFICPVSGMYFFTGTITSEEGELINIEIVIDGAQITVMEAGAAANRWAQATNIVIKHCNKNQHVWMRERSSGSQLHGNGFSSFSGFLLWQDEE